MSHPFLSIEDLHLHFETYAGRAEVLRGINLSMSKQDFMGLVGETGCGKSMTGLSILGLIPAGGEISHGRIRFQGEDLLLESEKRMQSIRGRHIALVSQDPSVSLNPLFTVGQQLAMVLRRHQKLHKRAITDRSRELLQMVELPNPQRILGVYPHELSGGMKQRVAIALALSSGAELLIADEPTTDLDVTIQAQILDLLQRLRTQQKISILLITHDLGVVSETCQRVVVLYAGQVVESGPKEEVLFKSAHPYTKALLKACPGMDSRDQPLQAIPGRVPGPMNPIRGCAFEPRCDRALSICAHEVPVGVQVAQNHFVNCHLYNGAGLNT